MSQASGETGVAPVKRAGVVTIAGQSVRMILQFVGLIAFSHLLSPRDVGLIAMLGVFLILGELIRDFGLSQAAIQTARLTHGQASNLFWLTTLVGVLLTLALIAAAPAVASMYNEPVLRVIAPWVALSLTINAAQTQFLVRLVRDFRFFALTVTDVVSQITGLVAGLASALLGAGYWALVIQMLVNAVSLLILRVVVAGWWPGRPCREPGMGALYRFGMHSGLAQLLGYAASNTDSYIIGIRWGAGPLGIYNRAFAMVIMPFNQLLAPLGNVALTSLSRARHDGRDIYPMLLKAQVAISAFLTFMFVLAGSLAGPAVHFALGAAWAESAALLSILSIGGAVQVLSNILFWAFVASGNAKHLLLCAMITKPLLVACVAIGSVYGIHGIAWGYSTGLVISWFIQLAWLKRCDDLPVWRFLRSGFYVMLCGLIAGGTAWAFIEQTGAHLSQSALLVVGFAIVTTTYLPLLMANARIRRLLLQIIGPAYARIRLF